MSDTRRLSRLRLPSLLHRTVSPTASASSSSEDLSSTTPVQRDSTAWWSGRSRPKSNSATQGQSTSAEATAQPRPSPERRATEDDLTRYRPPLASLGIATPPETYLPQEDPLRAHLHYRDQTFLPRAPDPVLANLDLNLANDSRYPSRAVGTPESPGTMKEDLAMREALHESRREVEMLRMRLKQEAVELRRALEESALLARPTEAVDEDALEQRQLSSAILESRRQALGRRVPPPRRRSNSLPHSSSASEDSNDLSASLAASEAMLRQRDEKGSLYSEGGRHGWLPLGAARPQSEEELLERRMLEMAIALSLEEVEAEQAGEVEQRGGRPARESPPPLPSRSRVASESSSSYVTALDHTGSLSARPPSLPARPGPGPVSLLPTPTVLRPKLTNVNPPSPVTSSHETGSPTEQPFLTPSTSFVHNPFAEHHGALLSTETFGKAAGASQESVGAVTEAASSTSSLGTSIPRALAALQSLERVDEGQVATPLAASSAQRPVSLATRSMSLISERTEPDLSSLALPLESPPIPSPATQFGEEILSIGPSDALLARMDAAAGPSSILAQQLVEEPGRLAGASGEQIFEEGVRFGYGDGLHSLAAFPPSIGLSSVDDGPATFSIESRTWVALLRFLMWYGDTEVRAKEAMPRRNDVALSLQFLADEEGSAVRLTIELLPFDHSNGHHELSVVDAGGKGKGRDDLRDIIFDLPDLLVLPTRLASISVMLYTLRHLASIASNTQASRKSSPSYYALRRLSSAIQALSPPRLAGGNSERLVTRLRDRLTSWRARGPALTREPSAKLSKRPPAMQRTDAVSRDVRVLANDEAWE